MSLRPPRVIFVHSGPRDSGSRGPILQSLWEQLPGPRPQAQPAWPSAGLSQGQMTSFSVAWSPRAPGPGSSESIRQAPLPMGTSILIWKKLQTHEQSSVWRQKVTTPSSPNPPRRHRPRRLSGSCVCGDPLGAGGGTPFTGCRGRLCFPAERRIIQGTLYFPFQGASVFSVLMNSRYSCRTYRDPGLSPFKLPSNEVVATEHRGFQKPQDRCGHKLERSLSRAHQEESTDKFFPPESPHPRCTEHSQGWRLGYPWQPTASAWSRRLQDHAWPKRRSIAEGGGVLRAVSPKTKQRRGCLCVALSITLLSAQEPGALKCTPEPLFFTRELPRPGGSQRSFLLCRP